LAIDRQKAEKLDRKKNVKEKSLLIIMDEISNFFCNFHVVSLQEEKIDIRS